MNYLMAYSKKYNYIIKWNAKSGCTLLRQLFLYLHSDEINNNISDHWHLINKDFPIPVDLKDNNNIPILHLVRNPYTRCVSMFCNKYIGKSNILFDKINLKENSYHDFSEYLLNCKNTHDFCDVHILPQSHNYNKNDIVIKLENFENDILNFYKDFNTSLYEKVKHYLNINNLQNVFINKTDYTKNNYFCGYTNYNIDDDIFPSYDYFYNENIKNNILNAYRDDFKLYNYPTNLIIPNHLNTSN